MWAMGVILFEILTFKKPFDGDSIPGVFDKIIHHRPADPLPEGTDPDFVLLVEKLLHKDKE